MVDSTNILGGGELTTFIERDEGVRILEVVRASAKFAGVTVAAKAMKLKNLMVEWFGL